nr:immunoglobulin light chain junction region [Macaca mulatta]MOW01598.1 immunoglobulin light chain junction region [Macaca mulatta]MOX73431.1 immunoglobulin light chain junction region [Macaca mulatta]
DYYCAIGHSSAYIF